MRSPVEQLMAQLSLFHFWRLQTINSNGSRRYECKINNNHHYYTATARTPVDAMNSCLAKVRTGQVKRPRREKPAHVLKLVGGQ